MQTNQTNFSPIKNICVGNQKSNHSFLIGGILVFVIIVIIIGVAAITYKWRLKFMKEKIILDKWKMAYPKTIEIRCVSYMDYYLKFHFCLIKKFLVHGFGNRLYKDRNCFTTKFRTGLDPVSIGHILSINNQFSYT